MADASIPHLASIKLTNPDLGRALEYLQTAMNNVARQTNASPVGTTPAPQPHAANSVVGGAGILDVSVTDNSPQYQGLHHFFDYSNDGWKTTHTQSMGPSKNWRGNLGSDTFVVRTYSQYLTSATPSRPLYHAAVDTSVALEPAMQAGQGSGTSLSGFGNVAFNTTKPPVRA
jgi:hypothetical protein